MDIDIITDLDIPGMFEGPMNSIASELMLIAVVIVLSALACWAIKKAIKWLVKGD